MEAFPKAVTREQGLVPLAGNPLRRVQCMFASALEAIASLDEGARSEVARRREKFEADASFKESRGNHGPSRRGSGLDWCRTARHTARGYTRPTEVTSPLVVHMHDVEYS